MTSFSENQIVTFLTVGMVSAFNGAADVSTNDIHPAVREMIRESILSQILGSNARITIDETVLVNCHGYLGLITVHPEHKDLLVVKGRFAGSEECDGEDAGMYKFWMNRSSLRNSLARVPRATPVEFFDALIKDNSNALNDMRA